MEHGFSVGQALRGGGLQWCLSRGSTHSPDSCLPTSVPQIFSQADTPLKRWLLEFAAKRKQAEVRSGIIRNDSIWDELFFNKIQVRK